MAIFITRVELHDATSDDYLKLHTFMDQQKFSRIIEGEGGAKFELPTGTYTSQSDLLDANSVRDLAREAAAKTGKKYWVLTTVGQSAWYLQKA